MVSKEIVITTIQLRNYINEKYDTIHTYLLVTGIFKRIAACAAGKEIETREEKGFAWWRTTKTNSTLNKRFPDKLERQSAKLNKEGHRICVKGKRMIVEDFKSAMHHF